MKKFTVLVIILSFILVTACNPLKVIDRLTWKTIESPRGFSVKIPSGYQVKTTDNGTVLVSKSGDKDNIAFFKTGIAVNDKASETDLAEDVIKDIKTVNEDAELGTDRSSKYGTVYKVESVGKAGILLVSESGGNTFASGLAASNKENLSNLMKTVKSFEYRPDLIDPSKLDDVIIMTDWTEPNEGAFTAKIPKGWTAKGGIERPYIDVATEITISKGDMGIYISSPHVPIYSEPNDVSAMAGFTEGSHYNPGGAPQDMIIKSWHDAVAYLQNIYGPEKGADIIASERSDLAANIPKNALTNAITSAEGEYTKNGIKNKVYANTIEVGMSPSYLWTASVLHYWAPPDKIKTVENILVAISKSVKVNQQWAAEEARQVQIRSKIISQTSNEIREMISSSFEYRSEVMDKTSHDFEDALMGNTNVYDEDTGEAYKVPNDSNYYWKKGDEIYGTDTSDKPYADPDFKELQILD